MWLVAGQKGLAGRVGRGSRMIRICSLRIGGAVAGLNRAVRRLL